MFRVAARREGGLVRTATAIRLRVVCVVFRWLVSVGLDGERLGFGGG